MVTINFGTTSAHMDLAVEEDITTMESVTQATTPEQLQELWKITPEEEQLLKETQQMQRYITQATDMMKRTKTIIEHVKNAQEKLREILEDIKANHNLIVTTSQYNIDIRQQQDVYLC